MRWFLTGIVFNLAFVVSALAQDQSGATHAPNFGEVLFKMLPMFLLVYLIFHLMVIKPQQRKMQDQQKLLESLKKGDSVVTTGGIVGKIALLESDHLVLEIASNVRVKMLRENIVRKYEKASEKVAEKTKAA